MLNKLTALAVFSLMFLLAGCSSTATEESTGLRTVPKVQELQLPDNTPGAKIKMATIRLEYVELRGHPSPQIEDKINDHIRNMIGMNRQFDGTEDLEMAVTRTDIGKQYMTVIAKGQYFDHNAIAPRKKVSAVVINLNNGERLTLSDLFQPGFQPQLNQLVNEWFAGQAYHSTFDSITAEQCFYWDKQYLHLCFSGRQVAPAEEGIVTVALKRESLDGMLRQDSPLQ